MREEVAQGVHDADGGFTVFDADVDVEAEDEVGAGDHLECTVAFPVTGPRLVAKPSGRPVCVEPALGS